MEQNFDCDIKVKTEPCDEIDLSYPALLSPAVCKQEYEDTENQFVVTECCWKSDQIIKPCFVLLDRSEVSQYFCPVSHQFNSYKYSILPNKCSPIKIWMVPVKSEPEPSCSTSPLSSDNSQVNILVPTKRILKDTPKPAVKRKRPPYKPRGIVKWYTCPVCGKRFLKPVLLSRHKYVHNPKSFECLKCGQKYKHERYLTDHNLRFHSEEKAWNCTLCFKIFSTLERLNKHIRINHKYGKIRCEHCKKIFPSKSKLKFHIKNKYLFETSCKILFKFRCNVCGRQFIDKETVKNHIYNKHVRGRRISCDQCGKLFENNLSLRIHKIRHDKNKDALQKFLQKTTEI